MNKCIRLGAMHGIRQHLVGLVEAPGDRVCPIPLSPPFPPTPHRTCADNYKNAKQMPVAVSNAGNHGSQGSDSSINPGLPQAWA